MHGTFFPLTVVYSPLSADHFHVYILPSSCITRRPHLRYCAALSKFVQFVKDSVRLLDVHLHLVKLYEISVKRSARNL